MQQRSEKRQQIRQAPPIAGVSRAAGKSMPFFYRSIAAMLEAGMTVDASLRAVAESDSTRFREVPLRMCRVVEGGAPLSEAMREFPRAFDAMSVNMVKAGETCGRLPEVLNQLAGMREAEAKLKRRAKWAMLYPSFVLLIALGVAWAVVSFVLPGLGSLYEAFGRDLPAPTKLLIQFGEHARFIGLLIAIAIAAEWMVLRRMRTTSEGRYVLDAAILKIPVAGDLARKVAAVRFARSYGAMLRAGVPILSALEISAAATGNEVLQRAILKSRESVAAGDPLSAGLGGSDILPPMLLQMLKTGEASGRIDEMLDSIAGMLDDEVRTTVEGLSSLLQPVLVIIIGLIVGALALSMLLPLFQAPSIVQ